MQCASIVATDGGLQTTVTLVLLVTNSTGAVLSDLHSSLTGSSWHAELVGVQLCLDLMYWHYVDVSLP